MGELWGEEYIIIKKYEDRRTFINKLFCAILGHNLRDLDLPKKYYPRTHRVCERCGRIQYLAAQDPYSGVWWEDGFTHNR